MRVSEIMNRKVDYINFEQSIEYAAKMMAEKNYGALPVEKNKKMIGMITDRDIAIRVVAKNKDPLRSKVGECMSPGIDYCFEDDDVDLLVSKMKISKHRRIPVVNKDKNLVGIVSLKELVTKGKNSKLTQETMEEICN